MTPLLVGIYRTLLRLYPASHRARVGGDMLDCFQDLVDEHLRMRGIWAAGWFAIRTFVDVPVSAWRAHAANGMKTRTEVGTMEALWQDARFALRGLVRSPVFTGLAVLSLGLGVGANTSMFNLVNSTLWTPLPVPEPGQLVRVHEVRETSTQVSLPNYRDIVEEVDLLEGGLLHRLESFALVSDQISQLLHGELVTANYFDVLGIEPAAGRFFDAVQSGAAESPLVAVLSHYLWTSVFAADPAIVGTTLKLSEHAVTIVGVAPASFNGTKFGLGMDLWVPVAPWAFQEGRADGWDEQRGSRSMEMVARLADGATLEGVNAALATLSRRLADEYPQTNANMTLRALPDGAAAIAPDQSALPNLMGLLAILGSALVLLVACGNVSSLQLARGVARRQEFGVRVALGAGRGRLLRQLMTESTLLALMGAAVGIVLTTWAPYVVAHLLPNTPYRFVIDPSPSLDALLFGTVASLLAVFVFGLLPALQASNPGIAGVLRGDDKTGVLKVTGAKLLNGVVVGVVALSFVTLFLAGLFASSLSYVRGIDPGFTTEGRMLATMDANLAGYSAQEAAPIFDELLAAVEALPGATGAAYASAVPMGDFSNSGAVFADDREYAADENAPEVWRAAVSRDWFEVADVRLLAGRGFTALDDANAPGVIVVNEALVRTFWPDGEALGQRMRFSREPGEATYEIVGVVETGKLTSVVERPTPALYLSAEQSRRTRVVLIASTAGDPATLIGPVRDAVRAIDPSLALYDVKTIGEHWTRAYWAYRVGAEAGLAIGFLAAVMAAAGLYGIMVFRVGQRRREMGIRIALGAGRDRVLRHVMRGSLRLVIWGVFIGAAIALAASGVVESLVFGVEPKSVVRLLGVGLGLTALALAATLAPAMSATRTDPLEAIKVE